MDVFHGLHDVQGRPVGLTEGFGFGDDPDKLLHGNFAVLQLDFRHVGALARVHLATEHLTVGGADHRLGGAFREPDAGLGVARAGHLIQLEHLGTQGTGVETTGGGVAQLVVDTSPTVNQNPAGVFVEEGRSGADVAGFLRENRPKLDFQRIVARTVGVLVG